MTDTHVLSQSRDRTGPTESQVTADGLPKGAEFFGVYFKPAKICITAQGFICSEVVGKSLRGFRHSHNYMPYAWELQHLGPGQETLVVVGVHFAPGGDPSNAITRRNELFDVVSWLSTMPKPFIIAGDFNFDDEKETTACLESAVQRAQNAGSASVLTSANGAAVSTNLKGGKPYDHVMYGAEFECGADADAFKVHRFKHTSADAVRLAELRKSKKQLEKQYRGKGKKPEKKQKLGWEDELAKLEQKFDGLDTRYGDHCPVSCTIRLAKNPI